MGEIADMMLDGTLDCETGEYLGKPCGYPRTARRTKHAASQPSTAQPAGVRKKDFKWLKMAAAGSTGALYPGIQQRFIPAGPANRLRKAGLIEDYAPHNHAHDYRWTATELGHAALARAERQS